MPTPLNAQRIGDDVLVTGLPDQLTATVHADGALTVTPAPGERLSWDAWRSVPVGAVLSAADELTHDDRVARLVLAAPALTHHDRIPGPQRIATVAAWYRRALAEGLTPRTVIAALYGDGVGLDTAKGWIREARDAGALGSLQQEREQLAARRNA